jgi:hypothetical protein
MSDLGFGAFAIAGVLIRMEQQRPLRLGDLVDDYCPRERRITNHAIVAIVEDAIRQTRCTACEADHVYKGGKAPVRKKKDVQDTLYDQVLTNVIGGTPAPPAPVAEPTVPVAAAPVQAEPGPDAPVTADPVVDERWSLNRPLIRASLPRNDSQPPVPRAIPEFTMHQRNTRGSQQFRGGGGQGFGGQGNGWHDRSANSNGSSNGHRGGFRPEGQGQGEGQPGAPNGQRPGGGRRRRRHKTPRPQN